VNYDGFVKSPSAALYFIFRHCSVAISTPHSSRFVRLTYGAFYCAVLNMTFYEFIQLRLKLYLMEMAEPAVEGHQLFMTT